MNMVSRLRKRKFTCTIFTPRCSGSSVSITKSLPSERPGAIFVSPMCTARWCASCWLKHESFELHDSERIGIEDGFAFDGAEFADNFQVGQAVDWKLVADRFPIGRVRHHGGQTFSGDAKSCSGLVGRREAEFRVHQLYFSFEAIFTFSQSHQRAPGAISRPA